MKKFFTLKSLLFLLLFISTIECRKEKKEEDLYGTWKTDLKDKCIGCNSSAINFRIVTLDFFPNSIAYINYQDASDSSCFSSPCKITWEMKREKKEYYLSLTYPDSCSQCLKKVYAQNITISTKYKMKWDKNDKFALEKVEGGFTGNYAQQEPFCLSCIWFSASLITEYVKFTKIK
jgi:hypothetical protein